MSSPAALRRTQHRNRNAYEASVERVVTAIENDIADLHTVDSMAAIAGFSHFHFSRIFTALTGLPPGQYLLAARIRRAMHLLATTDLSVTEITRRVGCCSIGTFSNRFSDIVGVGPQSYRYLSSAVRSITPPDAIAAAVKKAAETTEARKCLIKPGEYLLLELLRHTGQIEVDADGSARLGGRRCDAPLARLGSPALNLVEADTDRRRWRLTPAGADLLDRHLTNAP